MGRYYHGDIEGKFMFAVQSSAAPERFGANSAEPNTITYMFSKEQIPRVEEELKAIEKKQGKWLPKITKFFEENNGWNEAMLVKAGFPEDKINEILREYADHRLGTQILECLKENGYCEFEAEL